MRKQAAWPRPATRTAATPRPAAPLVLNYDFYAPPTPERKPEIDWVVKQFAKIDIQLEVRATDNNQFQDKVRKGKHQVFWLRLDRRLPRRRELPVPALRPERQDQARRREHRQLREPATTTSCFAQLKTLEDGPREAEADRRDGRASCSEDAPWAWASSPTRRPPPSSWVHNDKPAILIRDHGRYLRIDAKRSASRCSRVEQAGVVAARCCWPPLALLRLWRARRAQPAQARAHERAAANVASREH